MNNTLKSNTEWGSISSFINKLPKVVRQAIYATGLSVLVACWWGWGGWGENEGALWISFVDDINNYPTVTFSWWPDVSWNLTNTTIPDMNGFTAQISVKPEYWDVVIEWNKFRYTPFSEDFSMDTFVVIYRWTDWKVKDSVLFKVYKKSEDWTNTPLQAWWLYTENQNGIVGPWDALVLSFSEFPGDPDWPIDMNISIDWTDLTGNNFVKFRADWKIEIGSLYISSLSEWLHSVSVKVTWYNPETAQSEVITLEIPFSVENDNPEIVTLNARKSEQSIIISATVYDENWVENAEVTVVDDEWNVIYSTDLEVTWWNQAILNNENVQWVYWKKYTVELKWNVKSPDWTNKPISSTQSVVLDNNPNIFSINEITLSNNTVPSWSGTWVVVWTILADWEVANIVSMWDTNEYPDWNNFFIGTNTGELKLLWTLDFSNPSDQDWNNIYLVPIIVYDNSWNSEEVVMHIEVTQTETNIEQNEPLSFDNTWDVINITDLGWFLPTEINIKQFYTWVQEGATWELIEPTPDRYSINQSTWDLLHSGDVSELTHDIVLIRVTNPDNFSVVWIHNIDVSDEW